MDGERGGESERETSDTIVGTVSRSIFPLNIGPSPSLRAALRPVSDCNHKPCIRNGNIRHTDGNGSRLNENITYHGIKCRAGHVLRNFSEWNPTEIIPFLENVGNS